jgi:REP element-mobilizing transposase RayT
MKLNPQERERAAVLMRSLEQFDRAEQILLDLLARNNLYGESPWEIVEWEEMLDHVASLHACAVLIRARVGGPWTEEG